MMLPPQIKRFCSLKSEDRGFAEKRRVMIGILMNIVRSAIMCSIFIVCGAASSQEKSEFIWRADKSTAQDIAVSRNGLPFNYMVVGNLSSYSFYLVDHWMHVLGNAADLKIDRKLKSFSLVVVHDENVFSRLKNNRSSFEVLGIPSFMIDDLQRRAQEGVKCISSSFENDNHDILVTVILLSERYNGCLVQGLFYSFGIKTGINDDDFNLAALLRVCVLYDGRRSNVREREALRKQAAFLAKRCFERWEVGGVGSGP